jgi:hypothetical protein
MSHRDQR